MQKIVILMTLVLILAIYSCREPELKIKVTEEIPKTTTSTNEDPIVYEKTTDDHDSDMKGLEGIDSDKVAKTSVNEFASRYGKVRVQLSEIIENGKVIYDVSEELNSDKINKIIAGITIDFKYNEIKQIINVFEEHHPVYVIMVRGDYLFLADNTVATRVDVVREVQRSWKNFKDGISWDAVSSVLVYPDLYFEKMFGNGIFDATGKHFSISWESDEQFSLTFEDSEGRKYIYKPVNDPCFAVDELDYSGWNEEYNRAFLVRETPWKRDFFIYELLTNYLNYQDKDNIYVYPPAIITSTVDGNAIIEVSSKKARAFVEAFAEKEFIEYKEVHGLPLVDKVMARYKTHLEKKIISKEFDPDLGEIKFEIPSSEWPFDGIVELLFVDIYKDVKFTVRIDI